MFRIQTRCSPTLTNVIGFLLMFQAGLVHLLSSRGTGFLPTLVLLIIGAGLATAGEDA